MLYSESEYKTVVVFRSAVPSRDVGFLPGKLEEKLAVYEAPYRHIVTELFDNPGQQDVYTLLNQRLQLKLMSTSYVRGITLDDCIVVVDEIQNMSFHELDSIITRVGENCRIIFSGDYRQSDLKNDYEKNGLQKFLHILNGMEEFAFIEFGTEDICRSKLVKNYIIAKMND